MKNSQDKKAKYTQEELCAFCEEEILDGTHSAITFLCEGSRCHLAIELFEDKIKDDELIKIEDKLDECRQAITATYNEIKAEKKDLQCRSYIKVIEVCKWQRILSLRKHLGELKEFKKQLNKKLKTFSNDK